MNQDAKTIALAALLGLGVLGVAARLQMLPTEIVAASADGGGDIVSVDFAESKVVFDGGAKFYAVPVWFADGGEGVVLVANAPCKRRLPGNELCFLIDGGLPPELNRYPADALEGVCDGVACSVLAGVDADGPEVEPTPEGQP